MRDLTVTTAASMSSREIAELTGKRHAHVMDDCRKLSTFYIKTYSAEKSAEHVKPSAYVDSTGRSLPCFRLSKQASLDLVTGYSLPHRHAVNVRWQELEAQQQPDLSTDVGKLLMIQDLAAKQLMLVQENKHQAEKIESLESLFKEGMTATQFCKLLNGVNVMAINSCLHERNWLYNESKTGTRWRTASYARDRYLTEHQSEITPHGQEPFIKYTPVLLRKGAVRLHELYLAGELPMKKSWNGQFTHNKESLGVAV